LDAPDETKPKTTSFDVWGPFDVEHLNGWFEGRQTALWDEVEDRSPGLSTAIGCYMFCLQTPRQIRPWYVGMTVSKDGFRGEVFAHHKRTVYGGVMAKHGSPRSTPVLFFFPLMTPQKNYSTAGRTGRDVIEWMEHYLMTTAFARNSAIANIKGMTLLRRVEAPGILGKRRGRMDGDVLSVRRALFGSTRRPSSFG